MSDEALTDELGIPTDDAQVRAYLEAHPGFFERQNDLLASVRLPHAQRGSVSLVERQVDTLREKNSALQEEITQLMSVAQHNEKVYLSFCELFLSLLSCSTVHEVQQQIKSRLSEQLQLSAITMWPLWGQQDWVPRRKPVNAETLSQLVERRLGQKEYYFGRLSDVEKELIFDQDVVGSVALTTVSDGSILLAFGSQDASHFTPNLDVLLLEQLRSLVSGVLKQISERRNG